MIADILPAALASLAPLHAYWGIGGRWPGRDDITCARTVAGFRGIVRMPSAAAGFAVALVLAGAALLVLMLAGGLDLGLPRALLVPGGFALALVFLARGAAAYLPAWRRLTPEQPFARLDRRLYGPLCLVLGLLSVVVTISGK